MTTNHTTITLGELLSSPIDTIKRNALSILKTLQRIDNAKQRAETPDEHVFNSIVQPQCKVCKLNYEDCVCPFNDCCP